MVRKTALLPLCLGVVAAAEVVMAAAVLVTEVSRLIVGEEKTP